MTTVSSARDPFHFPLKANTGSLLKTLIMQTATYNEKNRNMELHRIFHRMADCYRYLGTNERFRAIAYETASRTLANLRQDIIYYTDDIHKLNQLKGIGESIAEKIIEYLKTGKIKTYEQLRQQVPEELLELLDINGFGPSTIKFLHERLHINNRQDLIDAVTAGKLEGVRGIGPKKIEHLKRGLKIYKKAQPRMLLWDAILIGQEILRAIRQLPEVEKAELAGSLRRGKETVGDIDIVIQADRSIRKRLVNRLTRLRQVESVAVSGETRISMALTNKIQVDIRIVEEKEFGAAMLYLTGSKEHNIKMRTLAAGKNCKLNEYGLFNSRTGAYIAGRTEEEIYRRLGLQYIAPELREDGGEIALAARQRMPSLVSFNHIKGDLQMHSRWSDGEDTIEHMAQYLMHAFPHYEYMVITDHSPGVRVAHGLQAEDFIRQFAEIDKINERLGYNFIKKGVEIDILEDGSMDLPDDMLQQFDWIIASIHNGFTQDNTQRLLKACENPYVHCIGHPSGRLIGHRDPYIVNWGQLFHKAALTGTAIEINAQPSRLDLRDVLARTAVETGVQLVINTDAHALIQFDFMQLGVSIARRAGCRKQDILNTMHWDDIVKFKTQKLELFRKKQTNHS